jgi:hypothetical protein
MSLYRLDSGIYYIFKIGVKAAAPRSSSAATAETATIHDGSVGLFCVVGLSGNDNLAGRRVEVVVGSGRLVL